LPFRFIHTADLHLDSPLRSLALRDPALERLIGAATRQVLTRIVDLCIAEAVDALLIAGDLYDGDQTSMKTARFLAQELGRLDAAGIRTFVVRGNHDALSKLTRELVLPASVKVFGAKAETVLVETGARPVAIHGISFDKPHAPDSLLDRFPPALPNAFNLGLMHTSLAGAPGHDPYAPCSLDGLRATGFDYWALGHIHIRAEYPGRTTVVMPGIPQARDIGEAGEKSVTLVTFEDDGTVRTAARSLALARFERLDVSAHGVATWPELVATLDQALRGNRRDLAADHLVLRLRLVGETPLAWQIRRDLDLLDAEARQSAESIGSLWIESVEANTTDPGTADGSGALSDLARLIAEAIPPSATLATAMAEATNDVARVLPPDLRNLFGRSSEETAARAETLLREGAAGVLAELHGLGGIS
jgi:exonuclease SbcD